VAWRPSVSDNNATTERQRKILRRAAAGETFRVRAGDTTVELQRSRSSVIEQLTATGQLSITGDDDFTDFPAPSAGVEPLGVTLDALRQDR